MLKIFSIQPPMRVFFSISPQVIRYGSFCYHDFCRFLEFHRSAYPTLYLSMPFRKSTKSPYFAEYKRPSKVIRKGSISDHDFGRILEFGRSGFHPLSLFIGGTNRTKPSFFRRIQANKKKATVPLEPAVKLAGERAAVGGMCRSGLIARNYLPSSFSFLYCAVLIPITAPINTAIADSVPTISSARGRFQIFERAKYKVPQAGNRIVHKNFRQS